MVTQREYTDEIESIAKAIIEDNEDLSDYQDLVHEYVDGHQWIIYTHYHLQIYANCDVEQGKDEMPAELLDGKDIDSAIQSVVFYQMVYDVTCKIEELTNES